MVRNTPFWGFMVALALVPVGCGGDGPFQSPIAPSSAGLGVSSDASQDASVTGAETTVELASGISSMSPRKTLVVRGKVARLSGGCPSRTFRVGGQTIVLTNRASNYRGGSCRTLANGITIAAGGTMVSGRLVAKQVEIDDDDDDSGDDDSGDDDSGDDDSGDDHSDDDSDDDDSDDDSD